jgi:DNA-binding CsgD family transcriptional regulator
MNRRQQRQKLGDVAEVLRGLEGGPVNTAMRREILASWIKHLRPTSPPATRASESLAEAPAAPRAEGPNLAPRMRETLNRLLSGDSEKQIAAHLGISQHTVHVYVKRLYRHYDVNSRGELLSHFITRP